MEEHLIALLKADIGVQAVVGSRIFPLRRPQGSALPAIVMTRISGRDDTDHAGANGQTESRVQFDIYAASYRQAKQGGRAVRALLSGLTDNVLQGVFLEGHFDTDEGEDPDRIFCVTMDFTVWAVEALQGD